MIITRNEDILPSLYFPRVSTIDFFGSPTCVIPFGIQADNSLTSGKFVRGDWVESDISSDVVLQEFGTLPLTNISYARLQWFGKYHYIIFLDEFVRRDATSVETLIYWSTIAYLCGDFFLTKLTSIGIGSHIDMRELDLYHGLQGIFSANALEGNCTMLYDKGRKVVISLNGIQKTSPHTPMLLKISTLATLANSLT